MFNKIVNGLGIKSNPKINVQTIYFLLNKIKTLYTKLNLLKKKKIIHSHSSNAEITKYFPFVIFAGLMLLNTKYRKRNEFNKNEFFRTFGLDTAMLHCYKVNNKELEKMMGLLENQIKNLEFRYQGKLRRQPIK